MSSRTLIVCLLGLAVAACDRGSPAPEQGGAATNATSDEVAAAAPAPSASASAATDKIDRSHKGEAAPAVTFEDAAGKPVTLAAFRGKPALVNLWATWCAPCVAEMPTLDAAARSLAGRVAVIAVSQDMEVAKVAPFFAAKGLKTLKPYRDPKLGLSLAYQANLPTTILFDAKGHEIWRVSGGFDWNGAEAKKLIGEAG